MSDLFTTVIAVDREHLRELTVVWPTWRRHRPEIVLAPMRVICDTKSDDLSWWSKNLEFLDHPRRVLQAWPYLPSLPQRERMLTSLVQISSRVDTPWHLKLDVDAVATRSDPQWIQDDWFRSNAVFVAPPWAYTKPAGAIETLNQWSQKFAWPLPHPECEVSGDRAICARITSWCFFGRTDWVRLMASMAADRLPVPSHDTFLWYCAARRGDQFLRVSMSQLGWSHVGRNYECLARIADEATK